MKILFVNPNVSLWVNVGMTYVMSAVAERHTVRLVDRMTCRKHFKPSLFERIGDFQPDVVAFSVNSFTLADVHALADEIKQRFSDITIAFGGVHPTILPEETISLPAVDVICIGEGELSFAEYLDRRQQGRDIRGAQGIWFKDKDGKVVRNELRPYEPDIEAFVLPRWDLWDIEAYMNFGEIVPGTLRLLTSRGCPYRCSFCSNPALQDCIPGPYYRKRRPEKIIAEIEHNLALYSDQGFKFLMISDSIFGLEKGPLRAFLDLYVQKGLHRKLPWGAQMRCSSIDEDVARDLRQAGCQRINISIESGNDHMRNAVYRKNTTKEQIRSAVSCLRKHNILVRAFVMIGGPGETNAMFDETLRFSRELGFTISDLIIIRYAPLPQTELTRMGQGEGLTKLISPFSYKNVSALTSGITSSYYFKLRLLKILSFIQEGFKMAGVNFLMDLCAIFSGGGKNRFIPLVYLCSEQRIINETIVRYKIKKYREVNS